MFCVYAIPGIDQRDGCCRVLKYPTTLSPAAALLPLTFPFDRNVFGCKPIGLYQNLNVNFVRRQTLSVTLE